MTSQTGFLKITDMNKVTAFTPQEGQTMFQQLCELLQAHHLWRSESFTLYCKSLICGPFYINVIESPFQETPTYWWYFKGLKIEPTDTELKALLPLLDELRNALKPKPRPVVKLDAPAVSFSIRQP